MPRERISWARSSDMSRGVFDLLRRRPMPPHAREIGDARHVGKGDDAAIVGADAEFALPLEGGAWHRLGYVAGGRRFGKRALSRACVMSAGWRPYIRSNSTPRHHAPGASPYLRPRSRAQRPAADVRHRVGARVRLGPRSAHAREDAPSRINGLRFA